MHPCFIDIATSYTAEAPYHAALGGTQAAVAYVSAELVKAGVPVTLINQHRGEDEARGVKNLPPAALDDDASLKKFTHLIFNGRWTEKLVHTLKKKTSVPLIAYMHEACFQTPHVLPLKEFAGFVFVSEWQKNLNAPLVPKESKTAVIPNGIAPAFENLFGSTGNSGETSAIESPSLRERLGEGRKNPKENPSPVAAGFPPPAPPGGRGEEKLASQNIFAVKSTPPVAIYAGSSKRGLLFLPEILPLLHRVHPDLRFEIYSDMVVGDEKENAYLRAKLAALPGVDHVGAVDQPTLAKRLSHATYFLSPNTYPETFCIALAEALAAGLRCIATTRAALPETAGGFAALMPLIEPNSPEWQPHGLKPEDFAEFASEEIARWKALPEKEKAHTLTQQTAFAKSRYSWASAAKSWAEFLERF